MPLVWQYFQLIYHERMIKFMKRNYTVYFIPITHHDLGYTHLIDELLDLYCRYYDNILDFCDMTDHYPDGAKYRYTVEQFWSLDYYLKHTSAVNIDRLKQRIREERIELPAFYANIIDCSCGDEELIRLMYPSFRFASECGTTIKRASLTDIPGMSGGIPDVLSEAGIKYLFAGFPRYFEWTDATGKRPEMRHSYWNEEFGRPAAFRWRSKSGGSILTWFQSGYGWFGNNENACVDINGIHDLTDNLPKFIDELEKQGFPYRIMRYIYRGSDNEAPSSEICDIVKEWNEKHSDTGITLKVATDSMFFEALEEQIKEIPELCGEIPHTDYTVLSLSEAEITAKNKISRLRLDAAERLGAKGGTGIYKDIIMYDEHCFGMSLPSGEENELNRCMKIKYALSASFRAKRLLDSSIREMEPDNDENHITFFSPFGKTTESIAIFLSDQYDEGFYRLKNEQTGEVTFGQSNRICDCLLPMPELTDMFAKNICGEGIYRCFFDIGKTDPMSYNSYKIDKLERQKESLRFENRYYRIDTESMSIFDKETGKYITDPKAEYPFGCILTRNIQNGNIDSHHISDSYKSFVGPVASGYVIRSSVYGAPEIITEIILHHSVKRIDVSVRLLLDRTPAKEIFVSFPFLAKNPIFSYQGVNFNGKAFDSQMSGVNTNHYTAQNRIKVTGSDAETVLSMREGGNVFFGGLHPTAVSQAHHMINPEGFEREFVSAEEISSGQVYVMLAYNNCRTNFAMTQQGDVIYQFSITSGQKIDEVRFSESFVYSPIAIESKKISYKKYIKPSEPNILIQHVKPAEDGNGMIIRLRETEGKETYFSMDSRPEISHEAYLCDITENIKKSADLSMLKIKPYGLLNIRLVYKV